MLAASPGSAAGGEPGVEHLRAPPRAGQPQAHHQHVGVVPACARRPRSRRRCRARPARPRTLLAAIDAPVPVQQNSTPVVALARRHQLADRAPDLGPLARPAAATTVVATRLEVGAHRVGERGALVGARTRPSSEQRSGGVRRRRGFERDARRRRTRRTTTRARPWRTRRRRAAPPCGRWRRRRSAPSSGPRCCASLIGACLHVPHDEHGQQRSSWGNRSSRGREVDRVGEHVEPERRARVVHVEAEAVGHHRELGARGRAARRPAARTRGRAAPRPRSRAASPRRPRPASHSSRMHSRLPISPRVVLLVDGRATRRAPARSSRCTPTSAVVMVPSKSRNTDVRERSRSSVARPGTGRS